MATTRRPASVPHSRRPACDSTVESGNPGMSPYSMATGDSMARASPPRPVPSTMATSGTSAYRARTTAAAASIASSVCPVVVTRPLAVYSFMRESSHAGPSPVGSAPTSRAVGPGGVMLASAASISASCRSTIVRSCVRYARRWRTRAS